MMTRKLFAFLILFSLLIITACDSLSKEEAIGITKNFVDKQVRPYVKNQSESTVVSKAKISVLNAEKKESNWYIYLNIKSNQTGKVKQSNVVVTLDAKEGNILNLKKIE